MSLSALLKKYKCIISARLAHADRPKGSPFKLSWQVLLALPFLLLPFVLTIVHASSYFWSQITDTHFNYGTANNATISSGVSLNSAQVSDKLSGTSINDTYIYEPDRETSTAYVAGTSVYHDANWRNGITKLHTQIGGAAYSADPTVNPSSNIHVSGVQSTASDKLRIKVTTAGTVGTAQYQYSTDDGSTWNGTDITTSTSLTQIGSTGVYLQFEESSSYTLNDAFKIASWFVESLDGDDRSSTTRAFPKKAILVITGANCNTANLYIYDAKDNSLWMRFDQNGNFNALRCNQVTIHALNGVIYSGNDNNFAMWRFDFIEDYVRQYRSSTSFHKYDGNIGERNAGKYWLESIYPQRIVNTYINDVHAAVISGKTYVAVATDGGVSVINEHDGTVVDLASNSAYDSHNLFIANDGTLYFGDDAGSGAAYDYRLLYIYNVQDKTSDDLTNAQDGIYSNYSSTQTTPAPSGNSIYDLFVTSGTSVVDGTSNTIYLGHGAALDVIQEKQSDESNGSVKYYTKDYITEELVGDIRGMYGFWDEDGDSTLANGDTISDLSVKDTDMTVVDGGGTAPQIVDGVRGKAIQFDGSNDYLKQKVYEDETGANWGATYHGLSLADGSAFIRVDNVDLSTYASAGNSYMIVMEDTEGDVAWGYIDVADAAEALGSELLSNTGFETGGTGGDFNGGAEVDDGTSDDFDSWTESTSVPNTIEATATNYSGSYAVKIINSDSPDGTLRSVNISVTAGKLYKLAFYTRGDGSVGGRYLVRDITNSQNFLTGNTSVTGTTYQLVTAYFTAPSDCSTVQIWLRPSSSAGTVYYDNVSLKEVTDVGTDGVHIMSTKGGSTQNWASISDDFDYNDSSYTFEVRKTDFQITGDLTIGAWVKPTASTNGAIISKWEDSPEMADQRSFNLTSAFGYEFDPSCNGAGKVTDYPDSTISADNWYFVAVVFDNSADTISLYLNGAKDADDQTFSGTICDSASSFTIARGAGSTIKYSNHTIDSPFITAEALSSTQILDMFNKGCRAMGGTPGTGTCTGIDEDSTTNTLAGSSNVVKGVSLDGSYDYAWVGTNDGADGGALSKIQLDGDLLSTYYTTATSPSIIDNDINTVTVDYYGNDIIPGTTNGLSILSPYYTTIGSLISGTSSGSGKGYDTGSTETRYTSLSYTSTGGLSTTLYLRGADDEDMSSNLTDWYQVANGADPPSNLDGKRYIQYEGELIADDSSSPTLTQVNLGYELSPTAPSGFAGSSNSTTSITWSWTDNSDNEGEYYVENESGTRVSPSLSPNATSWTENNLSPNTRYVRHASAQNPTGEEESLNAGVYTLANTPGQPTASATSSTALQVTLSGVEGNPNHTQFAIYETTTGKYVQADGTLGDTPAWQTYTQWGGDSGQAVTGLNVNTSYTFKTKARNGDEIETTFSEETTTYTQANTPAQPTVEQTGWTAQGWTTLNVTIDPSGNPDHTQYAIYETQTGKYVQADGTLGDTPVWRTYEEWGGAGGITATGLTAAQTYDFQVKARNQDGIETQLSNGVSNYTYGNINEAETTCQTYTVQPGDTLVSIAQDIFGDWTRYTELIELNKDRYPSLQTNWSYIEIGWELVVSCQLLVDGGEEGDKDEESEEKESEDASTIEALRGEDGRYTVKVKVIDTKENPIRGAKVALYSDPKEEETDEQGEATFEKVEAGEHRIVVAYNGKQGEERVTLEGDVKEQQITITIEETILSNWLYLIIIGILAGLLLLTLFTRRPQAEPNPPAPKRGKISFKML